MIERIGHLFISFLIAILLVGFLSPVPTFARSGCCSWHGGVCSYQCPYGGVGYHCCDGTPLSAKCAPYYSSCSTIPPAPKVEVKTEKETVTIPFETVKENDPNLLEGKTQVTQEGKNGKKEIVYEVTYTDGKRTSKKKISERIVEQSVPKIISVGTKQIAEQVEEGPSKVEEETPISQQEQEEQEQGEVAGAATKDEGGGGGFLPGMLTMALIGGGAFWVRRRFGS